MLTNKHLLILDKTYECLRKVGISQMRGLSKSTRQNDLRILVHVNSDCDCRFNAKTDEDRDLLFELIKVAYFRIEGQNIAIFGVTADLTKFETTK